MKATPYLVRYGTSLTAVQATIIAKRLLSSFVLPPLRYLRAHPEALRTWRVQAALETKWGRLFRDYGNGQVVMPGMEPKTVVQAGIGLLAMAGLVIGVLGLLRRRG